MDSTVTERGKLVSLRQDEDDRIAGRLRVGREAVAEFAHDRTGATARVRGTVQSGRREQGTHVVTVEVAEAVDCPGVTAGDVVAVQTGRDANRARHAPVTQVGPLDEVPVGSDARLSSGRAYDRGDSPSPSSGGDWLAAGGAAERTGRHPMRDRAE